MKNQISFLLLFFVSSFALMSCGGEEKETTTNEAPKTEATTPEKTPEKVAAVTADLANGEAIFGKACFACHKAGIAGANAIEGENKDQPRWEKMAAKGMKTLVQHATEGFTGDYGAMPAKGTCMDCSEQDLIDAISFMFDKVGVTAAAE